MAVKGVTGAGHLDSSDVSMHLDLIRAETTLPVCVGFGIKDAESATAVGAMADGVVVGSALIDTMAAASEAGGPLNDGVEKAVALLGSIRTGIDNM